MNRRKFLALGGMGLGIGGGYLGWTWYQSPTLPDGVEADTLHVERDVLAENFSRDRESLAWKGEYHTIIEDEETATKELQNLDSVTNFIEKTDFNESYIIVVQNGMQSDPDLVLDAIRRIEGGIRLEITIDAPWFGVNDDLITHSLLVSITDSKDRIPEEVAVDIDGYI